MSNLCLCGCGREVKEGRMYVRGHHARVLNPMQGKHHSLETKGKIGDANKGHKHSDEVKKRISDAHKGKKFTDEHKIKIACALKLKPHTLERIKKNSKSHKGIKPSLETRLKLSQSHKGQKAWNKGVPGLLIGEKNPMWNGGTSFAPYCSKFNSKLKEAVRNRDSHTCQLCNIPQNGRKLDVHHIHYDKENCYPDLIALCNRCHSTVGGNRPYYESLFMNKINDRSLLLWTVGVLNG